MDTFVPDCSSCVVKKKTIVLKCCVMKKCRRNGKVLLTLNTQTKLLGILGGAEGRCSRLSFLKRTLSGFIVYSDVHIHS